MLAINDERFLERAEIIWEKGTNRSAFFRGEVNKYGWVDVGSSFLPSDIIAAFLWAQLENLRDIQSRRSTIWDEYQKQLKDWANQLGIKMPFVPNYATNNAHMFYLVCKSIEQRNSLIAYLKENRVLAVFHYLSLHKSEFYQDKHDGRNLPQTDRYSDCLVRLPMFYELNTTEFIARLIAFK
jgi:dTDP-4-amino-4,6-dideoxygalactose transaminase